MTGYAARMRAPRGLTSEEVARLLATSGEHREHHRDYVAFRLALGTGLRSMELVALDWGHILAPSGGPRSRVELPIWKGKGRGRGAADQSIHIPPDLRELLRRFEGWTRREQKRKATPEAPLFFGRPSQGTAGGARLTERGLRKRWAHWREAAQIPSTRGFHSLRHTFGQRLYESTRDVLTVNRAMRHANLSTTTIYAAPSDEQVATAIAGMWADA